MFLVGEFNVIIYILYLYFRYRKIRRGSVLLSLTLMEVIGYWLFIIELLLIESKLYVNELYRCKYIISIEKSIIFKKNWNFIFCLGFIIKFLVYVKKSKLFNVIEYIFKIIFEIYLYIWKINNFKENNFNN